MSVADAFSTGPKVRRRDEIVAAARRAFRETGLEGTTLEMVAASARLPRPHLYRYFRDKSDLVSAVVAVETAEINERRRAALDGLTTFADRLVRALELAVELVHGDEFWSTLATPGNVPYTAYAATRDPELVESNARFWNPIFDAALTAGELRSDIDRPDLLTWLLGLQFMFLERREIFPAAADVGRFVRVFVLPALVPPERRADVAPGPGDTRRRRGSMSR